MILLPDGDGVYRTSFEVKRMEIKSDGTNGLSDFTQSLKDYSKSTNNQLILSKTMSRISSEIREVEETNKVSENVTRIKYNLSGSVSIPPARAYIYGNLTNLNKALSEIKPPTLLDIFNTWDRISDNEYFPGDQPPPSNSEASSWYWDDNLQSMVISVNSTSHLGFLSDEYTDWYNLDAVVTSPVSDDDGNGLILAFSRDGYFNNLLIAMVSTGYSGHGHLSNTSNHQIYVRGTDHFTYKANDNNRITGGWRGNFKRISVKRRGDNFNVRFSNWNSTVINDQLTINFNLNDDPRLAKFKGARQYGYYNHSQSNSSYSDIRYYGGFLRDIIVDAVNNQIYKYKPDRGWEIIPNVTAQGIFGAPRILHNQEENTSFLLKADGTIETL